MKNILMAEVIRGGAVESMHYGSGVLVSSDGKLLAAWGDENGKLFPRSAMKSIQTFTILCHGTKLNDKQAALACASHHGEEMHTKEINSWLDGMKLTSENLSCGLDLPRNSADRQLLRDQNIDASRIYHNCSGKHCGQLAFCQNQGWDIDNYHLVSHPAQKAMLSVFQDLAEEKIDIIGVDGCTLPAPYLSLQGFARALAKITAPNLLKGKMQNAANLILKSTIQFPYLTGGTKSLNSILTAASSRKFFAKNGAEGVYAVIFPEAKAAMVLKIADGSMRAANVAIAGMLSQMARTLDLDKDVLDSFSNEDMFNSANQKIGHCQFSKIMPIIN